MENPISSFPEFQRRLVQAIQKLKALAARYPDPAYDSIIKQLEFVTQNTFGGKRLRDEDLCRLSFGLLASKNVDDTDQPLARELYLLADALSKWPADRPVWHWRKMDAPVTIANFSEFRAQLAKTIKQISETRTKAPDDVLEYVEKQLRDVQGWTASGYRPSDENLCSLSFGIVASRDINDRHPELAEQLFALAGYLMHWK